MFMKRITVLLATVLLLGCFAACGEKDPCKKGHTFEKSTTDAATCKENAMENYVCAGCGEIKRVPIENTALGHHFENGFCTACGYADTPAVVREGLLVFSLNEEGKGYTVKLNGGTATGEITIPESCCTLPVVAIEDNGFAGQGGMTFVGIPDTVLTIGRSAFEGCVGLTTVTFGQGVETVGERAFWGCTALTEVIMRENVDHIGLGAFGGCSALQNMVLTFVGGEGVYYRNNPAHPQSVSLHMLGYIFGSQNYAGAQNVGGFYIPTSLSRVEVLKGNYTIAYYYGETVRQSYTLMQSAFQGCSMLREIVLPAHIQYIDEYALHGCTGLERLIAPGLSVGHWQMSVTPSLTTLDARQFDQTLMPNVTDLTLREVTEMQTFPELVEYDKLTELTLCFADNVKTVKFENLAPILDKITGLKLPSVEVELEEGILSGIATLKRATLPYNRLAGLNMEHFVELTVLSDRNYTVPQILFSRATALKTLTLDARATAFPAGAFANCTALERVTLDGTAEELSLDECVLRWVEIAFGGEKANPLSHGAALYFKTANGTHSAETLSLPLSLTAIGPYAFEGCSNLQTLTLGDRLLTIGQGAFAHTDALKTVKFAGALISWCAISFADAEANPLNGAQELILDGQVLAELGSNFTVASIPDYAFCGYLGLTKIAFTQGVSKIGSYAFAGCTALGELSLSSTVFEIGTFAFGNCTALTSATFALSTGWSRYADSSMKGGEDLSPYHLEDAARAAVCLTVTYVDYFWKKEG